MKFLLIIPGLQQPKEVHISKTEMPFFVWYYSNNMRQSQMMSFINYLQSPLKDKYCVTLLLKIVDEKTKQAAVVDPVEPDTVLQAVKEEGVNLTKVLTTHHHWYVYKIIDLYWILSCSCRDHSGGNEGLVKKSQNTLQVYGGDARIPVLTNQVKHGDEFTIGDINVQCLFTPCHTSGHICYYLTAAGQEPAVFTGKYTDMNRVTLKLVGKVFVLKYNRCECGTYHVSRLT